LIIVFDESSGDHTGAAATAQNMAEFFVTP
jgi:hypothetical protein